jgi:hypothetical protein
VRVALISLGKEIPAKLGCFLLEGSFAPVNIICMTLDRSAVDLFLFHVIFIERRSDTKRMTWSVIDFQISR